MDMWLEHVCTHNVDYFANNIFTNNILIALYTEHTPCWQQVKKHDVNNESLSC